MSPAPQQVTASSSTSSSPTIGARPWVDVSSSFAESAARQPLKYATRLGAVSVSVVLTSPLLPLVGTASGETTLPTDPARGRTPRTGARAPPRPGRCRLLPRGP